jgi:hypothetical protein
MVSGTTPMALAEGQHTMALDQSALLEVLEALKASEVDDRIRQAAETIYQALIEADLSSVIGARASPSPACHGHVPMAGLRHAGLPQR